MKSSLFALAVLLIASSAMAADDEAALKNKMREACAPVFAAGAVCDNLAKGSRACVLQNADKGGASCAGFVKENKGFMDAGAKDPIIKK